MRENVSEPDFSLLPRPRSARALGSAVQLDALKARLGSAWFRTEPSAHLGGDAYQIRLDQKGLVVTHPPRPNLHAERVLTQLMAKFGPEIPCLEIDDAPVFPVRGIMLDVSRGRVPTMRTLFGTIDLLGSLGANHLQLYTEHAFAYPGHEEVWRDASPITPADIAHLTQRCDSFGIALAANQNCFGHLTRWLTCPSYAHLAETHGDWDFEGLPRSGPFSLCPTDPGSIDLVKGLLDQLLPHFRSGLVNIGCDETADVGQGRSAQAVLARGSRVYADFVAMVATHAMARGFTPMFWADIALRHPEALEHLPNEMIALAWGYEPDAPFAQWIDTLRDAGFQSWVCPGTSSWRSFTGRTMERRGNIQAAAQAGVIGGAGGMLITDWGDLGHRQQWPLSLRGIADGLDAAWNGAAHGPADPEAVDLHVFGGAKGVAAWLDELGDADEPLRAKLGGPMDSGEPTRLRNASAIFNDLALSMWEEDRPGDPRLWSETLDRLIDLEDRVPSAPAPLHDELRHAVRAARVACDRAVALRAGASAERLGRIADELDEVVAEHRRLWLQRSRPGGLVESQEHYGRVIKELRAAFSHESAARS